MKKENGGEISQQTEDGATQGRAVEEMTEEAIAAFMGDVPYTEEPGESGMNNTTKRILAGGRRYVLRIYNTHDDMQKALFEHRMLGLLAEAEPTLSFRVPEPIPPRGSGTGGSTVLRLSNGKLAALFRHIEGRRPELRRPAEAEAFGAASGELMSAMAWAGARLGPKLQPVYPPYYELGSAHPRCSLPEVVRLCATPPKELAGYGDSLLLLSEEIRWMIGELGPVRELPHTLIHGDLNATNALAHEDGRVAALLDFEFVTVDVRAMEPAVCLWSLVPSHRDGEREAIVWESIRAYWNGFRSLMELEERERDALPLLMQLRSLDVFIHFLGRYLDGVDDPHVLMGQIPAAAARMRWVSANRDRLRQLFVGYSESPESSHFLE